MKSTFQKSERLKNFRVIAALFDKKGASFGCYPLRLIWKEVNPPQGDSPIMFALTVPKKKFKHAVDRNLLRRRLREAWRLNKHILYEALEGKGKQYAFMVLYVAKESLPYFDIEQGVQTMIRKFTKEITKLPAD